ncbi:PucR family transcriptional regulator [Pseudoclavibacter chungangensis]|uniref:PucR family transcriptional regulator n=1 Tax=Pseudoclavibacter chungangensis TaxID=587635 RepID=A0A7J5BTZ8_9MICO|nr:helix-turn-helix domain-containing protein [Pseudoclavibacter chungangensis]KAB1657767.1 PucR family transcriptional regulator [Pseudoclavibacter chungangensis]NYJ66650.1 hypothetical protein [Pseudoclavibacter chungangensis]
MTVEHGRTSGRDATGRDAAPAALDVTRRLLDAMTAPEPLGRIVAELATLVEGSAILYDGDGESTASSGPAAAHLIWDEIVRTGADDAELQVGRWFVRVKRVRAIDDGWWLALASKDVDLAWSSDTVVDAAERVLAALGGVSRSLEEQHRRETERLLSTIEDGVPASREHRSWQRLVLHGFDAFTPVMAVVASVPVDSTGTIGGEARLSRIIDASHGQGIPRLVARRRMGYDSPTVVALVPAAQISERWLRQIGKQLDVGVSAPFGRLGDAPRAFRDAETALEIAATRGRAARGIDAEVAPVTIRFDRMTFATWLLAHADGTGARGLRRKLLDPIDEADLHETLVTYLACDQHVGETAAALFVHANTVRYRLAKLAEVTGRPVESAGFVADAYLALEHEIIGRRLARRSADPNTEGGRR